MNWNKLKTIQKSKFFAWHARGHRFDSGILHIKKSKSRTMITFRLFLFKLYSMKFSIVWIQIILIIFFAIFSNPSTAQFNSKSLLVGTTYNYHNFKELPAGQSVGLSIEKLIGRNFGLEATFSAGKNNYQMGAASVAAPLVLLYYAMTPKDSLNLFKDFLAKVVILACLAEHINYHINLNGDLQLIPYISWLRLRSMKYKIGNMPQATTFPSGAIGMKFGKIYNQRWFVNIYGEIGKLYKTPNTTGFQAGLNVGYIFNAK